MARIKKPDIKRVPPEEVAKALGAEPVSTEACKQYHTHDDQQPAGYIARSDWGMRMSRTVTKPVTKIERRPRDLQSR